MKKYVIILLSLLVITSMFSGCKSATKNNNEKEELVVFAAASLTETLSDIGEAFEKKHENVNVIFNFDSSGILATQIKEGATSDIFLSASEKQMNMLDISNSSENKDASDYVLSDSRVDLLENEIVLVTSKNPENINSFDELAESLSIKNIILSIGNEDVPVGQYTKKIFSYYDLKEEELVKAGVISYGSNVKEVTMQVSEESTDYGIVYKTDAYSADLKVIDTAKEEMCGKVIYPAAVLKNSENQELAKEFLSFLSSDETEKIFESVGFTKIK